MGGFEEIERIADETARHMAKRLQPAPPIARLFRLLLAPVSDPKDGGSKLSRLLGVAAAIWWGPSDRRRGRHAGGLDPRGGLGGGGSGAVLEAPALVAGLDDLAVIGEAVEERGGHARKFGHSQCRAALGTLEIAA